MAKTLRSHFEEDEDTHEADELMINEIVYLKKQKVNSNIFDADSDTSNIWYLDNGASNYMSGNRLFFIDLDETIMGKIRFWEDLKIDVRGKGSIKVLFDGGEKNILNNVYYIPNLRSNIVRLWTSYGSGLQSAYEG